MTSEAAVEALAAGAGGGLRDHLRAQRPDLAWEAELARLEAEADEETGR